MYLEPEGGAVAFMTKSLQRERHAELQLIRPQLLTSDPAATRSVRRELIGEPIKQSARLIGGPIKGWHL